MVLDGLLLVSLGVHQLLGLSNCCTCGSFRKKLHWGGFGFRVFYMTVSENRDQNARGLGQYFLYHIW